MFDEIAKCIDSEAYRSAYIMVWISIAESLRNKLKKMSNKDAEVGRVLKELRKLETQKYTIDKELLVRCKDLGIIDNDEYEKLEIIRKLRNSFAHPTGNAPKKNEVICSLSSAVEIVLSRPPRLRHGYVNQFFNSVFNDIHFLEDSNILIKNHALMFVKRVHSDVLEYSLKLIFKNIENLGLGLKTRILHKRGLLFGKIILREILNEELINLEEDLNFYLDEYPFSGPLLLVDQCAWPLLPPQVKNRAFGNLIDSSDKNSFLYNELVLNHVFNLYEESMLNENQKRLLNGFINLKSINSLAYSSLSLKYYIHKIIDGFKSLNWENQNSSADVLIKIGPQRCESLDKLAQEQLGRNILQSAEGGSWSSQALIREMLKESWPYRITEGLILETLVNDDKEFRLKSRYFPKALKVVVKHPERKKIFQKLMEEIKYSKLKSNFRYYGYYGYQKALDLLEETKDNYDNLNVKSDLNDLINIIKIEEENENNNLM